MKKRIVPRSVESVSASAFTGLHPVLVRVLQARGILDTQELQHSLNDLHTPQQLKGLQQAVDLLVRAFEEQARLLVVGDFDADGATSTALMVSALQAMGSKKVGYLVPNRFEYGYGLTPEIVDVALSKKPDVLITVDNGISSHEGVARAIEYGLKVIVTDHHLPGETLPSASAIVNPNQPNCEFPSKNLAGVGVAFYVMAALRRRLCEIGWFERARLQAPNMAQFLDLVALGTIADLVPLDRNNRILVQQGLQRIRAGKARSGIKALLQVAKRREEKTVSADLAFAVAPRLNAAGRLDDMSKGIACLLSNSVAQALPLALELDQLNQERKQIESSMKVEALQALEALYFDQENLPYGLCLYDSTWHQGVIGILAARVKERYHRPVIVFADADDTHIKGSARSIAGLHLRDVLAEVDAQYPGVISKFGGHAMAAGLTLKLEVLEDFREAFETVLARHLTPAHLVAEFQTDGALQAEEFTLELAQQIRTAFPWGQHFEEPLFDGEFEVLDKRIVGQAHVKFSVRLPSHPQKILEAIAFNAADQWCEGARRLRLVYRLDVNEFNGNVSLQLLVSYFEPLEQMETVVL